MIDPAMQWANRKDQPLLLMMITSVADDPFELPAWYGQSTGDPYEDYLQAVRYTDDFVREVDTRLRAHGIADNTILCVLGDHGESFRADSRRGRWVPYEEVIRIPWVLRWPGHVEAGRRIDWPCSQMDVTPTLLTLLGFDLSRAGYDGRDALTPASTDRRLYFSSWFDQSPLGFVQGNRKVVYWPYLDQVGEYDLQADPDERKLRPLEGEKKTQPSPTSISGGWIRGCSSTPTDSASASCSTTGTCSLPVDPPGPTTNHRCGIDCPPVSVAPVSNR